MAKYYAPCEDTWPKDWPREVVDSADYERMVEQFATYREAASASIGADLSQQAIERISELESALKAHHTGIGCVNYCRTCGGRFSWEKPDLPVSFTDSGGSEHG